MLGSIFCCLRVQSGCPRLLPHYDEETYSEEAGKPGHPRAHRSYQLHPVNTLLISHQALNIIEC